ncbi:hypothetical protein STRDD11_01294 [Streptococcus sp. DD11]|nr:hypothetical protein STRDD11_01294 [Streptococcus sp. DD11]
MIYQRIRSHSTTASCNQAIERYEADGMQTKGPVPPLPAAGKTEPVLILIKEKAACTSL